MTSFTLEEMVEDMLVALQSENDAKLEPYFDNYQQFTKFSTANKNANAELQLEDGAAVAIPDEILDTTQEFNVDLAMKAIFVSETVANLNTSIQRTRFNEFDGIVFDDSWLIVLCELQSIRHRKVVIARLAYDMYVMPSCQAARCIVLILANSEERGLRCAIQTGNSFGTVLSHPDFMPSLMGLETPEQIVKLFKEKINDLKDARTGKQHLGLDGQDSEEEFEMARPFTGIKADIARRLPVYFDDFADGLMGYKTKPKLLAAIVFQYFATILPVIALGHSIYIVTNYKLSTKTVVYTQFFGSILYGIFSGNPMMMFQVSSVILLYCKVLYIFAVANHHDFHLLFGLTCFFSGIYLILVAIFNLSNLMVYSRGSVADMVDVFQTITFVQSVSADIMDAYEDYNCDHRDKNCRPGKFVLNIFTAFLTIVIAVIFHGIRGTRLFNSAVREFLSDMGTPVGVISSSIVALLAFSDIEMSQFAYNADVMPFKVVPWNKVGVVNVGVSCLLAIPLAMLIFLDHNLNMEFVSDTSNKLHKGCAPHFDMLVVGTINAAFGIFGMCPMQGIFPNTPLHIKQMGDVEITYDQGVQVKTLIRVRDTRLTQLIVGIMVGCSTFLLPLPLGYFPKASLNGLLIVIGFISMEGNSLIDRLKLLFTDQTAFPSNHPLRKVPVHIAHKFTFLQILQLGIISYVSFCNVNFLTILFPVCLGLLIPIRIVLLPKIFDNKYLHILDPPKGQGVYV